MTLSAHFPKVLYKYRDWNNNFHKKTLFEQEIYFASASKFNDPFEGNIPFQYDKSELTPDNIFIKMLNMAKEMYPQESDKELHAIAYNYQQRKLIEDPSHLREQIKQFRNDIENIFGILSLTTEPNNFLMWSHYGDSHKGFCIGLNSEIIYDQLQCKIGKVDYSDLIPRLKFFEPIEDFTKKVIGTKGKVWEYENEYRFLVHGGANKAYNLPKEVIVDITLGCKMNFKDKTQIIEHIKKDKPHCKIYEITQSDEKFELLKERIF